MKVILFSFTYYICLVLNTVCNITYVFVTLIL